MDNFKNELKEQTEKTKKKLKALGPVKFTILCIMLALTVLSFIFYEFFYGAKSGWCTNPDTGTALFDDVLKLIPKLVSCVEVCFNKTPRGRTVSQLTMNLIRWVTAILIVIGVLAIFGVNTTALITGAGVVTLVVGLGMQSLIADVVAGLFIVFENEFNIGDYITVDGFRGEVVSIGIRTTKLRAMGNIKIFNNNAIQGVLNHTLEPSIAKTLIDVEYGDRLPKIEEIIKNNVGKLQIPGALSEVKYDGVASLGASGVTLQFECDCYEADIFAVGRALNGAIKNMFDENGIGIPFPQIVVHNDD